MTPENVAMSRRQVGGEIPLVASELTDSCIYTGLFGSIDSARMDTIARTLINLAESRQISVAIIDLGNVEAIDSSVAGYMIRLGKTLKLVGISPAFCGISGALASTMVTAGVDLGDFLTTRDLKAALNVALEVTGFKIVSTEHPGINTRQAEKAVV